MRCRIKEDAMRVQAEQQQPQECAHRGLPEVRSAARSNDLGRYSGYCEETIPTGLLQQVAVAYAAAAPGYTPPPLVGETNNAIALRPMANAHVHTKTENGQEFNSCMIIGVHLRLLASPA
jgi:hypothetical protein